MPQREEMWRAGLEMVDRFVLVNLPCGTRQGEVE